MQNLLPASECDGHKIYGPDMYEFQRVVNLRRRMYIFSGMDEQCLFARSQAHRQHWVHIEFYAPCVSSYSCLFEQGKLAEAMEWQRKANIVTETLYHYNFMSGMFEVMRLLRFDCGPCACRFSLVLKIGKITGDLQAIAFDQLT
jgi:dihydrodipicolinate synthase/N-acetylneuraminate lyase